MIIPYHKHIICLHIQLLTDLPGNSSSKNVNTIANPHKPINSRARFLTIRADDSNIDEVSFFIAESFGCFFFILPILMPVPIVCCQEDDSKADYNRPSLLFYQEQA